MNIVCLDDEQLALSRLVRKVEELIPDAIIKESDNPLELLDQLEKESFVPDLIFTDIEMPCLSGIELFHKLKEKYPKVKVCLVTGYSKYAIEAYRKHIDGYLLKPVRSEEIESNIKHLFPNRCKDITIHCFGNFEIFFKNKPIHFKRTKFKEFIAYLVDRNGAGVTTKELIAILYNDDYNRTIQKMFATLVSTGLKDLRELGIDNLIIKKRNFYAINKDVIDCDYYNCLEKKEQRPIEYMAQYEWANY